MPYISKRVTTQGTLPLASNLYGTCSTAAGTATKEVSLSAFDVLVTGVTVHVKFTNGNSASSPKLKVGSTSAANIVSSGSNVGKWKSGDVVSFTYDGSSWVQNDAIGSQYGLSIDGRTVSLVENGGSSSITLPTGVTYSLTKSGNTITLSGSDGTSSSVTDSDTKYGLSYSNGTLSIVAGGTESSVSIPTYSSMTQTEASSGTSTTGRVISAKVLHDTIEELDDNTTYTISVSGHTLTLTPSSGTAQSVTIPDNDTKYGLSISGHTVSLVEGGTGTQVTVPDENTTYTIGVSGHTLTLTPSTGTGQSVTLPDTTYTLSISGDTLTLTPSSGTAQSVTIPSLKYTKDAPDNGSLRGNVVQNDVTNNVANGGYSLAEGAGTTASGMYSHSEGWHAKSQATASHAEGYNTTASGAYSHAEGWDSTSSGQSSHAEGSNTTSSGGNSHAEGHYTEASYTAAHAEGYYTKATRYASHAEGSNTTAGGQSSHAEGEYTTASGEASHAEGYRAKAIGRYSHSQNEYTIASGNQQTAIGKYNADDSITETFTGTGSQTVFVLQYDLHDYEGNIISVTIDGQKASGWVVNGNEVEFDEAPADGAQISITYTLNNYAFIIGNGNANNDRSNALAIKWDGTIEWKSEYDRKFGLGLTLDGNSEHTTVDIGWNYTNRDGAYLGLRSVDYSRKPGAFDIGARDGTNSCVLTGKPDGTLSWGGQKILIQPTSDLTAAITALGWQQDVIE